MLLRFSAHDSANTSPAAVTGPIPELAACPGLSSAVSIATPSAVAESLAKVVATIVRVPFPPSPLSIAPPSRALLSKNVEIERFRVPPPPSPTSIAPPSPPGAALSENVEPFTASVPSPLSLPTRTAPPWYPELPVKVEFEIDALLDASFKV